MNIKKNTEQIKPAIKESFGPIPRRQEQGHR